MCTPVSRFSFPEKLETPGLRPLNPNHLTTWSFITQVWTFISGWLKVAHGTPRFLLLRPRIPGLVHLPTTAPVQTYHRVMLMPPRTSKPPRSKSPPPRSGDASSDRTYARDDGHRSQASSSVPIGRTVNHKQIRGSCQDNGLVRARGASAGREVDESGRGSSRGRGSAGARGMNLGSQQQSHGRTVAYSSSGSGGGGRSSSISRASSPVAARVPPPMFIPASRGSPPPSRHSGASVSKQKSSSSGGNSSSNSRYTVMT